MNNPNLYKLYIEDSIAEANVEMNNFLGLEKAELLMDNFAGYFWEDTEYSEAKEGVYKKNYYLRDNLQIPYVSKELSKPKVRDAIINFIGKFLDDHSTQLSTSGPVHIFTFNEKEVSILYELFNINADIILKLWEGLVNETYYGKISSFITGWIKNAPHKLLIIAMLIESIQKGYDDITICCEYMYIFTEYPIVYRNFWKLGVKEEVMNYTIEHLGSKYKVRKVKNLQELLHHDIHSAVVNKIENLKLGIDNVYVDLMQHARNNIKNTFKNIARAYYANDEMGLTQHTKDAQFDDGTLTDQEGHSTNMAQAIDHVINKFATGSINTGIVKIVADAANIDKDNLTTYINQIMNTKGNKLYKLVEDIITAYFNKNPTNTSCGSSEFLNFGLSLYRSIGTSKDETYQEIKSIINYWMNDIIDIRSSYSSEGTIISYTRAIFNYIIFMIYSYN